MRFLYGNLTFEVKDEEELVRLKELLLQWDEHRYLTGEDLPFEEYLSRKEATKSVEGESGEGAKEPEAKQEVETLEASREAEAPKAEDVEEAPKETRRRKR